MDAADTLTLHAASLSHASSAGGSTQSSGSVPFPTHFTLRNEFLFRVLTPVPSRVLFSNPFTKFLLNYNYDDD